MLTAISLVILTSLYLLGIARLWRRAGIGRGVTRREAACGIAAVLLLAGLSFGPLHEAAHERFSAHMLQHMLLMLGAGPLLALGQAAGAVSASLARVSAGRLRPLALLAARSSRIAPAAILHGAALWLWHMPAAYVAAIESPGIHFVEHASILVTSALFWHALRRAWRHGGERALQGAFWVLASIIHTGMLGAILTFAPGSLYHAYGADEIAIADQQLAGLVMWIPSAKIYILTGAAMVAALLRDPSANRRRQA